MAKKFILLVGILYFGFFAYAAPAHAQTASDFETQQQLASLYTYLDSLKGLLVTLQNLLFSSNVARAAAPVILGSPAPQATNIVSPGAQITWSTDIPSDSWVYYGTTNSPTNFPYNSNSRCDAGGNVTSHCVNLTGLATSTIYYFKVLSCAGAEGCAEGSGYSFTSASDGGGGGGSVPAAPSNLHASSTSSQINLYWTDNATNEDKFNVERKLSSGSWSGTGYFLVQLTGSNFITYTDTSVSPGTTYDYRVQACLSGFGCSSYATYNSVYVPFPPDITPPTAPTGLTAAAVSTSQINLSWNASTDDVGVAGYKIYRGGSFLASVSSSTFIYNDIGLPAGTTYNYTVAAYDAAGNISTQSGSVSATTLTSTSTASTSTSPSGGGGGGGGDTSLPTTPTSLVVYYLTSNQLKLRWATSTDNFGVTGYKIYRNQTYIGSSAGADYTDSSVTPSTGYYYTVAAYDAAGNLSPQSVSVYVNTPTSTATSTPSTPAASLYLAVGGSSCIPTASSQCVYQAGNIFKLNLNTSNWQSKPFRLCSNWSGRTTNPICTGVTTTDSSGIYIWTGTWDNSVVGSWDEWVELLDSSGNPISVSSPHIFFAIAVPSTTVTTTTTVSVLPTVDIKVDGLDGTAYRQSPAYYTLTWTTTGGVTSCLPGGTWSGSGNKSVPSGSNYFSGVTVLGTKTYTLTCYNSYGSASDTVYVEITSQPSYATSTTYYATSTLGTATTTTTYQVAAATLKGIVADASGRPVAGAAIHIFSEDFSLNFGAVTLSDGTFLISMRGGTYLIEVWPPSNRYDLIRPAPQKFSINDGETKTLNLSFSASLKTISGTVTFGAGAPVTDAEVGAYSSDSGQWTSTFVDASGGYKLNVGGGHWQVGIRSKDPSIAKWFWTGEFPTVDFSKDSYAESRVVNFVIQSLDTKLTVQVQDQDGHPLSGAGVVADTVSASISQSTLRPPVFAKTDSSGKADFVLLTGTYYLRAFLPSDLGYLNPNEVQVQLASGDAKSIMLVFRKPQAAQVVSIPGTAKLQGGKSVAAFIWAWSDKGGVVNLRSSDDGSFLLALAINTKWHVGAGREIDNIPYKTSDIVIDTSAAPALIELVLERFGIAPLAPPVTVTQAPTEQVVARVQDGAQITLPPSAVAGTAPINVEINPTVEAPSQAAAKVVSTVYDVNVTNNIGQAIKILNQETEIIIPYKLEDLKAQGVTEDTVVPSFYDESSGTWVKVDNYTIDKVKRVVVMRVKHLTRFALIAAADVTPPISPTSIKAVNGGPGEIIISWTNPAQDFSHVKIYRSAQKNTLGDIIVNNLTAERFTDKKGLIADASYYYTVRAVDPAGNESLNAEQIIVKSSGSSSGVQAKITRNLKFGMRGEDVKTLQELLIKEAVYPEGLVTGFFGNLTRKAVVLFQEKYISEILKPAGLKQGTGFVGAGTRAKIEKLLQ